MNKDFPEYWVYNLPRLPDNILMIVGRLSYLYAGTWLRGLWQWKRILTPYQMKNLLRELRDDMIKSPNDVNLVCLHDWLIDYCNSNSVSIDYVDNEPL